MVPRWTFTSTGDAATDNAQRLRMAFAERVLALEPSSTLDAGAGRGQLAALIAAGGAQVTALEADSERVEEARALGLDARIGSAEELPFEDESFDVVAMRNVLHHLVEPARAVRELCRVARRAVVLAEPWRDLARPAQATSEALDAWSLVHDKRLGRVHEHPYEPGEIEALLPDGWTTSEIARVLHPSLEPLDELGRRLAEQCADLPESDPTHAQLAALLELAGRTGSELTGSAVVVATRDAPAS